MYVYICMSICACVDLNKICDWTVCRPKTASKQVEDTFVLK